MSHYTLEKEGQVISDYEGQAGMAIKSAVEGASWNERDDIEATAAQIPTFLSYLKAKRHKEIDQKTGYIMSSATFNYNGATFSLSANAQSNAAFLLASCAGKADTDAVGARVSQVDGGYMPLPTAGDVRDYCLAGFMVKEPLYRQGQDLRAEVSALTTATEVRDWTDPR